MSLDPPRAPHTTRATGAASYRVRHLTRYDYAQPVTISHHAAHLTPRDLPHQRCTWTRTAVRPEPATFTSRIDYFGNLLHTFTVERPHIRLEVEVESLVEIGQPWRPDPRSTPPWEVVRDRVAAGRLPAEREAYEYAFGSPFASATPELADFARVSFTPGRPILAGLSDLTNRIYTGFRYDPAATTIATPLAEVMANRAGVCQDFAHLQIACLRALGLPARYISGYVLTHREGGADLVGGDASHAWLALWIPDLGWVDADPTNDLLPGLEHVTVAWGRDYDDVSPIKGVMLGGGEHTLTVAVTLTPLKPAEV